MNRQIYIIDFCLNNYSSESNLLKKVINNSKSKIYLKNENSIDMMILICVRYFDSLYEFINLINHKLNRF